MEMLASSCDSYADNLMKLRIGMAGLVCAMTLFASTGLAGVISVTNPSFETLPAGGIPVGCGTGCAYSDKDPVPGWTATGEFWGQFQPGTQDGNFSWFNSLSDGTTIAFIGTSSGTISQTVGATVQTGATYTLLVDVGQHNSMPFAATADLLIGGVRYFAVGTAPPVGGWSTYMATYLGLPQDAGDPITIELSAAGNQGDFDNVRLTDAPAPAVPEPNYYALVGAAIFAIGLRRRGCVKL